MLLTLQVQQQQQQEQPKTRRAKAPRQRKHQQTSANESASSQASVVPATQVSQSSDIVLYYCTGWPQAKLHCSINAGEWQDRDFEQVSAVSADILAVAEFWHIGVHPFYRFAKFDHCRCEVLANERLTPSLLCQLLHSNCRSTPPAVNGVWLRSRSMVPCKMPVQRILC